MNYNLNRKLRTKQWYEERIKELKEITGEYKAADKLSLVKPHSIKVGDIVRCENRKSREEVLRIRIKRIEKRRWELKQVEKDLVSIFQEDKQIYGTAYTFYGKIVGRSRKKCYIEIDAQSSIVVED